VKAQRTWSPSSGAVVPGVGGQPSYRLAHWWPRFGAVLIDGLLLAPLNLGLFLAFHLYTVTHEVSANGSTFTSIHSNGFWLPALLYLVYSVVLLSRGGEHNGQTLGKQTLGLRVIRNDGQPLDMRTALVREGLVKTLPGLLGALDPLLALLTAMFGFLDYLWPLREHENRAIHDLVAATHVVQTKAQGLFTPGAREVALVGAPTGGEARRAPSPGTTMLSELPLGRTGYLSLQDVTRDGAGNCWIDPAARLCKLPDDVHVVRLSNAPEGLFVSMPRTYEPLLGESPSEGARREHPGLRRATLSFS
jgi:uncharacterized RDD family membrane protein YckC